MNLQTFSDQITRLRNSRPKNKENYSFHAFLNNIEFLVKTGRINPDFDLGNMMQRAIDSESATVDKLLKLIDKMHIEDITLLFS
jgi:hypothetical protein